MSVGRFWTAARRVNRYPPVSMVMQNQFLDQMSAEKFGTAGNRNTQKSEKRFVFNFLQSLGQIEVEDE